MDSIFSSEANTIKELRKQLHSLVEEIKELESNPYQRVVVYVDDLDRIDPEDAVSILELLKNIFNIKDCVFVLAIDYQVVVKGLKEKFGEPTPENEWEFRSFFDKIIQLPFSMPMGSYDIGKYILSLLDDINYYESDNDQLDEDLIESLVTLSIGTNPRSIKRLINSLSLIKILNDTKNESSSGDGSVIDNKDVATVMLAMVCLQIANSDIYDMLVAEPTFTDSWNEDFAYKITQKKEEVDETWEENFKQAVSSEDFDEPWEQCLYRVCYVNPRQRTNATKYSRFLSDLRENYKPEEFQKFIATALKETLLLQFQLQTNQTYDLQEGSFKPHFNVGIDDWKERVKEDNSNYDDCPKDSTMETVNLIINTYKKSFNAVDQESEENKEGNKEFTVKYAGGVTFYRNKKSSLAYGLIEILNETMTFQVHKNAKDNQI